VASVPSETGRTYDLNTPRKSCLSLTRIEPSSGGLFAIGEFRGQKIISREAVDSKTGRKIMRHRLVVNCERLDGSGQPMALEFNTWEDLPAELPFKRGDVVIAEISGEFNGVYGITAVAPFGS